MSDLEMETNSKNELEEIKINHTENQENKIFVQTDISDMCLFKTTKWQVRFEFAYLLAVFYIGFYGLYALYFDLKPFQQLDLNSKLYFYSAFGGLLDQLIIVK